MTSNPDAAVFDTTWMLASTVTAITSVPPSDSALSREAILSLFGELSNALGRAGVTGEICVFGGTAMVLAFSARLSTRDIEHTDVADIIFLIRHLGLTSAAAVLDIVAQYYPANQIPPKTQYLIEGLFEEGKI
jgi:hypothetical protein